MSFHKPNTFHPLTTILLFLFTLAFSGPLAAQDTYVYVEDGFEVDYPSTWRLDASKTMGPVVFFYSPPEGDNDQFQENVNLLIQELGSTEIDLKEYTKLTKEQVKDWEAEIIRMDQIKDTEDGIPEGIYEYTANQFGMELHILQRVKIKDGKAYLLTYTAGQDTYDQYLEVAEGILQSFQFTPATDGGE
ncbi:MAG: hypothetical protein AAFN81_32205 [Bacteroidota bacterium]